MSWRSFSRRVSRPRLWQYQNTKRRTGWEWEGLVDVVFSWDWGWGRKGTGGFFPLLEVMDEGTYRIGPGTTGRSCLEKRGIGASGNS